MIIDRSELLTGRVIFAGASHIRPSIGSFPFYRRYSVRSGHPVALDRVNLSRAPHCPAAFSLGNEVMETRLDLPFLRRTTCNFTPSFFSSLLSPLPFRQLASSSFPSSVLSIRLPSTAPPVCRNRIRFAVSSTSYSVYSVRRVQREGRLWNPCFYLPSFFFAMYNVWRK